MKFNVKCHNLTNSHGTLFVRFFLGYKYKQPRNILIKLFLVNMHNVKINHVKKQNKQNATLFDDPYY